MKLLYGFDGDGRCYRLPQDEPEEIEITEAVAKAFTTLNMIQMNCVEDVVTSDGTHHLCSVKYDPSTSMAYWSAPITNIVLKTAFKPLGEGKDAILVPRFNYDKRNPKEAVLSIPWVNVCDEKGNTPRIVLVIEVNAATLKSAKQYLFAFGERGGAYRMPMSNLYNTCELCCGEFDRYGASQLDCVKRALEQFRIGQWNTDLFTSTGGQSENFFRFKPLEKGFETLPIVGKWTDWCEKVSTPTVRLAI